MLNRVYQYIDENTIFAELYNYGLKVGWSEYIRNPDPEIRCGKCSISIPKVDKEKAIEYLRFKFPQADDKLISNIVKEYIV